MPFFAQPAPSFFLFLDCHTLFSFLDFMKFCLGVQFFVVYVAHMHFLCVYLSVALSCFYVAP